jgi:predicted HNH restriction endonuclease
MESLRVQDTTFPIIASAIEHLHRAPEKFVSRQEIAQLLMLNSRRLVETAYEKTACKMSIEEYAGNMVDWFSARWTAGDQKWLSLFTKLERSEKKIDGYWAYKPVTPSAVIVFPDDVEGDGKGLPEGAAFQKLVNAYERNPLARQRCIKEYGPTCCICGFSFGVTYGEVVDGLIHVHHLLKLSEVGKEYKVDPIADLRPVCPNCHAVIHHRRDRAYSIEEVRSFLISRKPKAKPRRAKP